MSAVLTSTGLMEMLLGDRKLGTPVFEVQRFARCVCKIVPVRPAWDVVSARMLNSTAWASTDRAGVQMVIETLGHDRCREIYDAFVTTYAMLETT